MVKERNFFASVPPVDENLIKFLSPSANTTLGNCKQACCLRLRAESTAAPLFKDQLKNQGKVVLIGMVVFGWGGGGHLPGNRRGKVSEKWQLVGVHLPEYMREKVPERWYLIGGSFTWKHEGEGFRKAVVGWGSFT